MEQRELKTRHVLGQRKETHPVESPRHQRQSEKARADACYILEMSSTVAVKHHLDDTSIEEVVVTERIVLPDEYVH